MSPERSGDINRLRSVPLSTVFRPVDDVMDDLRAGNNPATAAAFKARAWLYVQASGLTLPAAVRFFVVDKGDMLHEVAEEKRHPLDPRAVIAHNLLDLLSYIDESKMPRNVSQRILIDEMDRMTREGVPFGGQVDMNYHYFIGQAFGAYFKVATPALGAQALAFSMGYQIHAAEDAGVSYDQGFKSAQGIL